MGVTRNIFDDVKEGGSFADGNRLYAAQVNALYEGARNLESALYRASVSNWFRATDEPSNTGDICVYDATLGLWITCVDGTNGTTERVAGSGHQWQSSTVSGGMVASYTQECAASDGAGTVLFGGGSAAVSTDERIIRATDGKTFSRQVIGTAGTAKVTQLAWDPSGSVFIAGLSGNGGPIYTSPTGVTWTSRTPPAGLAAVEFVDIASNEESGSDNMVIITAGSGNYAWARATTSFATWTAGTFPVSGSYRISYAKGQGLWIAANATNSYVSSDGLSWTAVTMPSRSNLFDVHGMGDLLVAFANGTPFGTANVFMYSADGGTTWSYASSLPSTVSQNWGFGDRQIMWIDGNGPYAYFSLQI